MRGDAATRRVGAGGMASARRGECGTVLRRLLLGLLPLVVLLVLAEGLLWALGLGGGAADVPLGRGFDPHAAYLVPDGSAPGAWRTQIFDGLGGEVVVPPKGDAVRVVLLGGSNTQSFPHAELQRQLDAAAGVGGAGVGAPVDAAAHGARRFEVINLGRAGYGSERVAILGEQALGLEPDVVVIYSGHNEFVEGGFRIEVQAAAPGWLARTGDALGALRSYRLLADAFGDVGPGRGAMTPGGTTGAAEGGRDRSGGDASGEASGEAPAPEAVMLGAEAEATVMVGDQERRLGELDWSESLVFYEAFGRNLRGLCERLRDADVAVVLCTVVSNDLLGPTASGYPRDMSPADRAEAGKLLKRAFALVPERLKRGLFPPIWLRVHDWGELLFAENPEQRPRAAGRAVPALRPLLGALASAPATSGPHMDSVAGAHWPDPALWSDRVFDLLAVQSAWLLGPLTADERERLGRARMRFDEALAIAPDHPRAHFWSGLCSLALGDAGRAAASLADAARYDRAPRKGNVLVNDRVRALAAELGDGPEDGADDGSGVRLTLLDADALFRERVPDGILGYEVMMDMCHLQPGARVVLMHDLVAPVRAVAGP